MLGSSLVPSSAVRRGNPCQCTYPRMLLSLNRSTVTGMPSPRRISGAGALPLYPVVRIVFPGATSAFTGPMRRVTSAGELCSGTAVHAEFAATPARAAAAEERNPRRVRSRLLQISLLSEGSTIKFTSIRADKTDCQGLAIGLENGEAVDLLPEDGTVVRIHLVEAGTPPATDKKVDAAFRLQLLQVVIVAVQIDIDGIFFGEGKKPGDGFF